ncbi:MAG: hypothetical protein GQ575_03310 [Deltaproteobacteria bacterium]|nr:hypothetical protein [Deltaproteobacteria bacterium]
MTYTIRFLPEVEEDVIAGYAWYEEKAPGLPSRTLDPSGFGLPLPGFPTDFTTDLPVKPSTTVHPQFPWIISPPFLLNHAVNLIYIKPFRMHSNFMAVLAFTQLNGMRKKTKFWPGKEGLHSKK